MTNKMKLKEVLKLYRKLTALNVLILVATVTISFRQEITDAYQNTKFYREFVEYTDCIERVRYEPGRNLNVARIRCKEIQECESSDYCRDVKRERDVWEDLFDYKKEKLLECEETK